MRRTAAPTPGDPAPSPDADKAVLAEQLRVLYIEGQRLILTGVAAALILVWVLWDHVPHAVLLGWLAVFGVYSLARAAMARAWRRRAASDTDHRAWMRRVQWVLAVGGSIWAAACFLFYVPDHIEYQLFLVTMLLGAVVSGLVTLAVYLPAYLAFVTPFVAATAIRYGQEGDPLHWGIALAAIVTFFLFINFARFIQNSFVESLRLRMTLAERNRELAERNRELAERNREVERANLAKSRFLAVASHDLRQPLHALNLFAAQLRDQIDPAERAHLVSRIDAAIGSMNELFNALLDISKLDAGVLAPDVVEFPIGHLLDRIETTFAAAAREKGLRLCIPPSRAWVRSDAILLERILLNLVSNAIRYTSRGGVARRLSPPRRQHAHRGVGQRHRPCRGPAPQHLRRVLPGGRSLTRRARRAGPWPVDRRWSVPPARPSDRPGVAARQGLALRRFRAVGVGPRAAGRIDGDSRCDRQSRARQAHRRGR